MENLIEKIRNALNIPYITEEDTVQDGCFLVVPYAVSGIHGNGKPMTEVLSVSVELFYEDKSVMNSDCTSLWIYLINEKYICSNPEYTYEQNKKMYRCTINVDIIGGN